MMYFNALRKGLSEFPEIHPEIRAHWREEGARVGWPALHARLQEIDEEAYHRIKPQDAQRIARVLEVYEQTGRSLTSFWKSGTSKGVLSRYQLLTVALMTPTREALHARIETRTARMLEEGFIAEVKALQAKWTLSAASQSIRTVGYRQCWEYLEGLKEGEEVIPGAALADRIVVATRQLAKRQLTWLRHMEGLHWVEAGQNGVDRVLHFISAGNCDRI